MRLGKFVKKHLELTFLVLLVALCIGAVIIIRTQKKINATLKASNVCSTKTNEELLIRSAKSIEGKDLKSQKSVVEEIKKINGYEYDQNCLYPLIKYYLATGDADNSVDYFNKLTKIYKLTTIYAPYSDKFGSKADKPELLRNYVESLQKQKAELIEAAKYDVEVKK